MPIFASVLAGLGVSSFFLNELGQIVEAERALEKATAGAVLPKKKLPRPLLARAKTLGFPDAQFGDVKTNFIAAPDARLLPSGVSVRTYHGVRSWISVPGPLTKLLELASARVALRRRFVTAGVLVDFEALVFLRRRREPSFYQDL